MEPLTWVFFESTAALSVLIGLSLFFLLVYWRRTSRPRPLLIGLAISVVLFVTQELVVTRREHAERVLAPVLRDLMANRTDALAVALAPAFRAGEMNREGFLAFVRPKLALIQVHTAENTGWTIVDSAPDRFTAHGSFTSNVTTPSLGQFTTPSVWRFTFVRVGDHWQIERIEPETISLQPMPDWQHVGELH